MSMYLTIFGKPRYLGLVLAEDGTTFEKGEQILVESSRGTEIAVVAGEITERQEGLYRSIDNRQEGQSSSDSGLQNVNYLSRIDEADLARERENRNDEDSALVTARQVLSRHALDMKLVDVEFMHDRKKLFLYFTSEQRVDFRAYVRDLAREFRTRIELRQIGVRDESKVVKGLGACGRVCCCSYWLQRFMPIGIKMVKEQNLALNPTKISGLCGRLMCCMSFEQDNYRELWKKLPAHGAKIKTEQGTWILTGVDLASKSCTVHGPTGNISVPVELYQKFKETILAGGSWEGIQTQIKKPGTAPVPLQEGREPSLSGGNDRCENCRQCPVVTAEQEIVPPNEESAPRSLREGIDAHRRHERNNESGPVRKNKHTNRLKAEVRVQNNVQHDEEPKTREHSRRSHGQKRLQPHLEDDTHNASAEDKIDRQRAQRRRFPRREDRKNPPAEKRNEYGQQKTQEEHS